MPSKRFFWLALSLIAAFFFALTALHPLDETAYTVNDDARVHLFWVQRFIEPELFPGDLIADYFQSVAPLGFTLLYKIFALGKINPFIVAKFLPICLILITTFYCFEVVQKIFPIPFAGFVSSLLLNQNLFLRDDIYSSTPRAFFYPLFLAFLFYLLSNSTLGTLIVICLQGLFYPHTLLISSLTILLITLNNFNKSQPKIFKSYVFYLILSIFIILLYSLKINNFGPVITVKEARTMAEFLPNGRSNFFTDNPLEFWLFGERSGVLPQEWPYTLAFSFGCLIPLLKKYPQRFPLVSKIKDSLGIFLPIILASILMFILAHLLLFKLHLPSRYTQHTIRLTLALADGIVIAVLLDSFLKWITNKIYQPHLINLIKLVSIIVLIILLIFPSFAASKYPERLSFVTGKAPKLYEFLKQQPKTIMIASLTSEADFIPTFAQRSVLTSEEYAIPYHTGYYNQIRQRTKDLIHVQYTQNQENIKTFIEQYKIDFWLLDKQSFTPEYIANNPWLMQFPPEVTIALENLNKSRIPVLQKMEKLCPILEDNHFLLLDSNCLIKNLDVATGS